MSFFHDPASEEQGGSADAEVHMLGARTQGARSFPSKSWKFEAGKNKIRVVKCLRKTLKSRKYFVGKLFVLSINMRKRRERSLPNLNVFC